MHIFVIHYSKLTERKKHSIEQFKKHGITDYEFVEVYDKEVLTNKTNDAFIKGFSTSKISLILKHFYVYRQVKERYEHALILEDDVILSDVFMEKFSLYISELPNNYDMLCIGDGCNLHIPKDVLLPKKHIYEKVLYPTTWGGDGATRCTDSYVISKKCATKLCDYIDTITYKIQDSNIDWWLNRAARDNQLNVYWAEPTIVTQGSENGLFKPTLYTN